MKTINMHEAKTNLSRLVDDAVAGQQVVIARSGRPLVRLVPIDAPDNPPRTGFLQGQSEVPDDFDTMHDEEIRGLFDRHA